MLIGTPEYLNHRISYPELSLLSAAFVSFVLSFSNIIDSFDKITELKAVLNRLYDFDKSIKMANQSQTELLITQHENQNIIMRDLEIFSKNGDGILRKTNLQFLRGRSYLLYGKSGIGKSTFFRTLMGIWPNTKGQIFWPKDKKIFFLPQKSYIPTGTLKNALLYPHHRTVNHLELIDFLESFNLSHLTAFLDVEDNWALKLSSGEQQCIGFIRIFLAQPQLIFLDEATSALDEETEKKMYHCLKHCLSSPTIISIGHRSIHGNTMNTFFCLKMPQFKKCKKRVKP